ncbi:MULTISPECIES: chemotaxis protein CheW [Flammeovirga]|uniref:Purine-binding chemotaxis protein CheW n=1 Tax=Flammeovirga agarivorans TaxID=2726742 RepID=A0A7X8SG78_9BACT|nr:MULTISPECIES: chemotaxis protein CheW [Flammeovirga]NLR89638.1 purine-binding chemotaxis protein CheW [Flammeovirga agarivorans]
MNLEEPNELPSSNDDKMASAVEMNRIETEQEKKSNIIVFRLGEEEYGLHIDQIKEVVITPRITKVPLTPSYVKGVANIRGNILAIIDLEDKFSLNRTISETSGYTLVVESHEYNMAILVKDVPNTLSVADTDIDYSPSVVADMQGEHDYINGIIKIDDRLIILIDIFKIITKEDLKPVIGA